MDKILSRLLRDIVCEPELAHVHDSIDLFKDWSMVLVRYVQSTYSCLFDFALSFDLSSRGTGLSLPDY